MKANFSVKWIPPSETYEWILKKHYAHRIPSISYAFGLYELNILKGICTFGKPASNQLCIGICGKDYSHMVIELNRLCVDSEEINITSWFVSKCLNLLNKLIVVSYADTAQGHIGKIYQACNFLFTGTTKKRTDIDSGEGKHSRHYDKTQDYSLNRKERSSKHRYVYICGNKTFKKQIIKVLKYNILDYPKGKTNRYDASYNPISQIVMF